MITEFKKEDCIRHVRNALDALEDDSEKRKYWASKAS